MRHQFPPYDGELPLPLNPLNPRHYLLLAYWIYFRPVAFKNYLYRADPELYRRGPGWGIFHTWRVPAYRNLYLMCPILILGISVVGGLALALTSSWWQGTPVDWTEYAGGVADGVAFGVAIGAMFGVAFGVMLGQVKGVVSSLALSLALGIVTGIMGSGLPSNVVSEVAVRQAGGTIVGLVGGMAFSVVFGVLYGQMGGLVVGLILSLTLGLAFGVTGGRMFGVAFGIGVGVGVLRLIFYLPQLLPALLSRVRGGGWHPLAWDDFGVLPLPRSQPYLTSLLQADQQTGLRRLARVAANPFQRWAVQGALISYLHQLKRPLPWLYLLLAESDLGAYVYAPASKDEWARLPSSRQLLLGELAGEWVDCTTNFVNRLPERIVWSLTRSLHDLRPTPLTRFAGLLYHCLESETVEADDFDLARYREAYLGVQDYPGGAEIAATFEAMAIFLTVHDLENLAQAAAGQSGHAAYPEPIRPHVLAALDRLADIGAEVAAYRAATSRVNQLAALARATDALQELDEYVAAQIVPPEQHLLRRIIHHWSELVIEAGGAVGRQEEAAPVANPYIAGNPVSGALFVGRSDILRRLEELWGGQGQSPSVVLYGHRRMGKSSILHNLNGRFGPRTTIVDFNMQRVGLVTSPGELLHNLALALFDSLPSEAHDELTEPDEARFLDHNPYTAFDRFLKRLDRVRSEGQRFIITIDEFELIEQMIRDGHLAPRLLDFWRGLIQSYPWVVMAFAGLHTLQEMTEDYWHPLFGSVTAIPISFLRPQAARQLITQPSPEFELDYEAEAIDQIITLTHGQPYLIQLIGHGLVTRYNRQRFEEGLEREPRFTAADVQAVITAPEFYRDGNAYFTGVWAQAGQGAPGQQAVLGALAHGHNSASALTAQTGQPPAQTLAALKTLRRHDVVYVFGSALTDGSGDVLTDSAGGVLYDSGEEPAGENKLRESQISVHDEWAFTVELMRRWVADNHQST